MLRTLCLTGVTLAASAEIILLEIVTSCGAVACWGVMMFVAPELITFDINLGWGVAGGGAVFCSSVYYYCLW